MTNILLTGSSGFLAKEFKDYFKNRYNLFSIPRESLIRLDGIKQVIDSNHIDYILHTSWAGVGLGTKEDYTYNIKVHKNIESISNKVKKIFIFGSGAEFPITDCAKEEELPKISTGTYYALAKNEITHSSRNYFNIFNLRLFGCFGKYENDSRLIKRSVLNLHNGNSITIIKDKEMDFFYVMDLVKVIEFYINNECHLPKELNCVYTEKLRLSDIANFLITKYSRKCGVEFIHDGYDKPYTGSSTLIDGLGINFKGLYQGIKEIYGN